MSFLRSRVNKAEDRAIPARKRRMPFHALHDGRTFFETETLAPMPELGELKEEPLRYRYSMIIRWVEDEHIIAMPLFGDKRPEAQAITATVPGWMEVVERESREASILDVQTRAERALIRAEQKRKAEELADLARRDEEVAMVEKKRIQMEELRQISNKEIDKHIKQSKGRWDLW